MESIIFYELARNNVYGALSRALGDLQHNCMGLLAEKRAEVKPAFKNDALYYIQNGVGRSLLVALQEFCDARLQGESYEDARRELMKNFTPALGAAFDEERFKLYQPSYMAEMESATDLEKESAFRYRHLDEFRTAMQTVHTYLSDNKIVSWSAEIIFSHLYNHLDGFISPEQADKGFGKFGAPDEIKQVAAMALWFRQRSAMAQAKASMGAFIDASGLSGVFSKMVGETVPERIIFGHYSAHCQAVNTHLGYLVSSGRFLQILRESCPPPKKGGFMALADPKTPLSVNIPQALVRCVHDFNQVFRQGLMIHHMQVGPDGDAFQKAAGEALSEVMADFLAEYQAVQPESPAPAASKRRKRELVPA